MSRPSDPQARSRLLEAAKQIFAKKGLDRAKVQEITAQAGLSKGAFYLHFESKERAFFELVSCTLGELGRFIDEYRECHSEICQKEPSAFTQYWLQKDLELFEFIWKNRALMRLTLEGGGSSEHLHLIEHFALRAQSNLEQSLKQGMEAGIYRADLDVPLTAAFIAGGYDRFARQLVRLPNKPRLLPQLEILQRMFLLSVANPPLLQEFEKLWSARTSLTPPREPPPLSQHRPKVRNPSTAQDPRESEATHAHHRTRSRSDPVQRGNTGRRR